MEVIEMDSATETLQQMLADFLAFLPDLLAALVIFVIGLYVAGSLSRLLRRALETRKVEMETTMLLSKLSRWSVILFGTIVALQQVGFDLSAFLAGLGILGFTVGFALQDVSKNFVSGLLLLWQQPFDMGDVIEVGEFVGTVADVDLRATEIYTFDGQNVLIPNADVFTSPIKNYSKFPKRRLELKAGVAYDSDLDLVRKTVLETVTSVPGVLNDPEPAMVFDNFGGSTIDFTLYYWIDTKETNLLTIKDAVLTGVNAAFTAKGIEMPFPTQTVRLQQL
jgi:small conductance mechanosensitive channel